MVSRRFSSVWPMTNDTISGTQLGGTYHKKGLFLFRPKGICPPNGFTMLYIHIKYTHTHIYIYMCTWCKLVSLSLSLYVYINIYNLYGIVPSVSAQPLMAWSPPGGQFGGRLGGGRRRLERALPDVGRHRAALRGGRGLCGALPGATGDAPLLWGQRSG